MLRPLGSPMLIQVGGSFGVGLSVVFLAMAPGWEMATVSYALLGLFTVSINVPYVTLRQMLTPPDMLGRVAAITSMAMKSVAPLSMAGAGAIAVFMPVRKVLMIAGVFGLLVAFAVGLTLYTLGKLTISTSGVAKE